MKTKLSKKFFGALILFSLMGQVAWTVENMYLNVFIYKMFRASPAEISAMVAASAVAATVTTVFIGALSDKIGKRKLFISGGYILWGISILCFSFIRLDLLSGLVPATVSAASVGVALVIAFDCLMTFFGSSANDAAFNAWLTDSTDDTNRGAAEGINAMMPLVSILVVFGGFMSFDLDLASSWTTIFLVIGFVVIGVGILGLFILDNPPIEKSSDPYLKTVFHSFMPKTIKAHAPLYLYLIGFALFNISIQIFMPYLILYYEVALGMADYVLIMAPAVILAAAVTALWGRVYDKRGFAFSVFISLLSLCLGYILLASFESKLPVFIGSLFMMCGFLSGMAVFGAKIRDLTPLGEAGRFQGIRIVSQVLIPGIVGPYIGKTVLTDAEVIVNSDGTESFIPNQGIFVAALITALIATAATVLILRLSKRPPRLNADLTTPFEEDEGSSWEEYPRPQMQRDSYLSLNGEWALSVLRGKESEPLGKIRVPFPPESRLSGIRRPLKKGESYLYSRRFTLSEDFFGGRILLHFGACDQVTKVTVNGRMAGGHIGGYLPFSFDITELVEKGENEISVHCLDPLDKTLPYGKQREKRGGMWYTPTSGIWQSVWLEAVPDGYIRSLHMTPTLDAVTVETVGGLENKTLTLHTEEGDEVFSFSGDSVTLSPKRIRPWSPEDPYLYRFTLSDGRDTVRSYFALRTVSIGSVNGKPRILLNGKPIFFHGLLDQGYFSDGIYLPATPRGYENDILAAKACGFNTLRKHIKIEPELFYYYCDKHGMLVLQDMVNSGPYSFLLDTALPTLGLKRGITHRASEERKTFFEEHSRDTVDLLYNHPSVVYYTIFNEGWGQYEADRLYRELKAYDNSRIFDATSGWFGEKESDVDSEHVYFKRIKLSAKERPLILSEFGGYSCKIEGHSFNLDKTYGYRFFTDKEEWMKANRRLYEQEILPAVDRGLSGAILTQLSDVEDETNGLLTYDRQVLKAPKEEWQAIADSLFRRFESCISSPKGE